MDRYWFCSQSSDEARDLILNLFFFHNFRHGRDNFCSVRKMLTLLLMMAPGKLSETLCSQTMQWSLQKSAMNT